MARMVFTGGCSNIPGLKTRITDEVAKLVEQRGWDLVNSNLPKSAISKPPHNKSRPNSEAPIPVPSADDFPTTTELDSALPDPSSDLSETESPREQAPRDRPHVTLAAEAKRDQAMEKEQLVKGVVRGVESLGVWAGGSLMGALRVGGSVEIERERFQKEGMVEVLGGLWEPGVIAQYRDPPETKNAKETK